MAYILAAVALIIILIIVGERGLAIKPSTIKAARKNGFSLRFIYEDTYP